MQETWDHVDAMLERHWRLLAQLGRLLACGA